MSTSYRQEQSESTYLMVTIHINLESTYLMVTIHINLDSFVCLGFNVTFKHVRSHHDGACLYQWYFDQCAATQGCQAEDTGHDTPPRHSIHVKTQGRPVVVPSIDVERHTGIHNYPF